MSSTREISKLTQNPSRVIKRFAMILWTNLKLKRRDENVIDLFIKTARRVPNKVEGEGDHIASPCSLFQVMMTFCDEKSGDRTMTFKQCQDKTLQIAHYFKSQGYKKVRQRLVIC